MSVSRNPVGKLFKMDPRLGEAPDPHLLALSEFFVIVLVGVAFEATIEPVHQAFKSGSGRIEAVLLLFTFMTIAFRFLIGNFRHLRSNSSERMPAALLLYDMFWIGLESVVMIYLGSATSIEENPRSHGIGSVDYIFLQSLLFLLDVLWILSQVVCGLLLREWKRKPDDVQWRWLIINLIVVVILVLLKLFVEDVFSICTLGLVAGVSFIVFLVDVFGITIRGSEDAQESAPAEHVAH